MKTSTKKDVVMLPLGPRAVERLRPAAGDERPVTALNVCCELAGGIAVMGAVFALVYLGMWAAGDDEHEVRGARVTKGARP